MKKNEAIKLLNSEGWTKADAQRALELINFNHFGIVLFAAKIIALAEEKLSTINYPVLSILGYP